MKNRKTPPTKLPVQRGVGNDTEPEKMLDEIRVIPGGSNLEELSDSRFWIVTVDSDPMPWEVNQYPYQIVWGRRGFVESLCNRLNSKKGKDLYEYIEVVNQEIVYENVSVGEEGQLDLFNEIKK